MSNLQSFNQTPNKALVPFAHDQNEPEAPARRELLQPAFTPAEIRQMVLELLG